MAAQGLVALCDFGFRPTFTRNFALAFSGVKEIKAEGLNLESANNNGTTNWRLLYSLLGASKLLYLALSLMFVCVLLVGGGFYFQALPIEDFKFTLEVLIAWGTITIALGMDLYFTWVGSLLIGAGKIRHTYFGNIAGKTVYVSTAISALGYGGGLTEIAFCYMLGVLVSRLLAQWFAREFFDNKDTYKTSLYKKIDYLSIIWRTAWRAGMVALGTFLISRSNIFIVTTFLGVETTASYAVSQQILLALVAVGQLPFHIGLPQFVSARVAKDKYILSRLTKRATLFYLTFTLSGLSLLVSLSQFFLEFIESNVAFLPPNSFLLLGIVLVLEGNHSNFAHIITTSNRVPFLQPALFSGLAVVVLATFAAMAGTGLVGIIFAQGAVQLAYNNWKWPLVVIRELR